MLINATAINIINEERNEYEFYFYMGKNITEKEILDKAFEIACGKYINLEEVIIDSVEDK